MKVAGIKILEGQLPKNSISFCSTFKKKFKKIENSCRKISTYAPEREILYYFRKYFQTQKDLSENI